MSVNAVSSLGLHSAWTTLTNCRKSGRDSQESHGAEARGLRKLVHSALRRHDSAWIFLLASATLGEGVEKREWDFLEVIISHTRDNRENSTQKILISYTGNIFDYEAGQTVEPGEFHRAVLSVETFNTYCDKCLKPVDAVWMEDWTTWPPNFTLKHRLFCNSRVIWRWEGIDSQFYFILMKILL